MSDRRTRPVVRCADPSCVHLGYFHGTRNRCPVHFRELVDRTDAANDTRRFERMMTRRSARDCEVCGDAFRPARSDASTCSARCRQRKRRANTKASRLAASQASSRDTH